MTKDEALKLALEALEEVVKWYQVRDKNDEPLPVHNQNPEIKASIEAISAIKEALMLQSDGAKPEPWEKFCDSNCVWTNHHPDCKLAEQEPVAWMTHSNDLLPLFHKTRKEALNWVLQPTPLYTTPPQRKPLSDEEIYKASTEAGMQEHYMGFHSGFIRFARAIEAAHNIKGEA